MRLPTFSHTKFDNHRTCPQMMKYKSIDKLCPTCKKGPITREMKVCPNCNSETVTAPPLIKGIKFAKASEAYMKGHYVVLDVAQPMEIEEGCPPVMVTNLPAELPDVPNEAAKTAMQKLRMARQENPAAILIEYAMKMSLVGYEIYGELDVLVLDPENKFIQVIDWKTGSLTPGGKLKKDAIKKYLDQLELYAILSLSTYEWCDTVATGIYFVSASGEGRKDGPTYTRAQLPSLLAKWSPRVKRVMEEKEFKPQPGFWCSWCDYRPAKGGPCTIEWKKEQEGKGSKDPIGAEEF